MRTFHVALLVAVLGTGACSDGSAVAERTPRESRTAPPETEQAAPSQGQTIRVFFSPESSQSCGDVTPVQRDVTTTRAVATAALNELFKGPTAKEGARGLSSFFGPDTTDLLRSLRVENGVAYVDLGDITDINNVSTSCGSTSFLAQMDATLKQSRP